MKLIRGYFVAGPGCSLLIENKDGWPELVEWPTGVAKLDTETRAMVTEQRLLQCSESGFAFSTRFISESAWTEGRDFLISELGFFGEARSGDWACKNMHKPDLIVATHRETLECFFDVRFNPLDDARAQVWDAMLFMGKAPSPELDSIIAAWARKNQAKL